MDDIDKLFKKTGELLQSGIEGLVVILYAVVLVFITPILILGVFLRTCIDIMRMAKTTVKSSRWGRGLLARDIISITETTSNLPIWVGVVLILAPLVVIVISFFL